MTPRATAVAAPTHEPKIPMKLKPFLTLAAASLALSFSVVAAEKDETPLGKEMAAMNKNLRTLKRQLADPAKKEDNLAILAKIKKNTEAAHELEPAKTKDQADKPTYTNKYKEQVIELGKAFGELEAAIMVDKQDEAKAALEKISKLKEKGHKDFGVDED